MTGAKKTLLSPSNRHMECTTRPHGYGRGNNNQHIRSRPPYNGYLMGHLKVGDNCGPSWPSDNLRDGDHRPGQFQRHGHYNSEIFGDFRSSFHIPASVKSQIIHSHCKAVVMDSASYEVEINFLNQLWDIVYNDCRHGHYIFWKSHLLKSLWVYGFNKSIFITELLIR